MVIVTELLTGGTLRKYLVIMGPRGLDTRVAIRFALDMVRSMECLHSHGIIHRVLKPKNLLLIADHKIVKLVDFGLAREELLTEMMTAETGTYRWMAPESTVKRIKLIVLVHCILGKKNRRVKHNGTGVTLLKHVSTQVGTKNDSHPVNCKWKPLEKELYVKGLEVFGKNSCFIARNLLSGLKTCIDVANYMRGNGAATSHRSFTTCSGYGTERADADHKIVNDLLSLRDTSANVNALTRDLKTALDIAEGLPLSEDSSNIIACLTRCGAVRAHELNQPRDELRNTVTQIKNDVHTQLLQTRKTNKLTSLTHK